MVLTPRPGGLGRRLPYLCTDGETVAVIGGRFRLQASHLATVHAGAVVIQVPAGEPPWAVLVEDGAMVEADGNTIAAWQAAAEESWRTLDVLKPFSGRFFHLVAENRALGAGSKG